MALIPCPRCGNPVSDKARQCPKCGESIKVTSEEILQKGSQKEEGNNRPFLWIIISIIAGILIAVGVYLFVNQSDAPAPDQKQFNYETGTQQNDSISGSNSGENASVVMPDQAQLEAEALTSAQTARKNATAWDDFSTPDLVLLDLHGHVKSVAYDDNGFMLDQYLPGLDIDHYDFNKKGHITNLNITRNNKNQITGISNEYLTLLIEWKGNYPDKINYALVNQGGDVNLTYYHNQLKYITSYSLGGSGGFQTRESMAISPIEFDNRGNWIKAKCIAIGMSGGRELEKNADIYTVKRTITYY